MPSYESIVANNPDLIRKALGGIIFAAPMTATVPASFTSGASADLTAIATDYKQLGLVSKSDGITFSRDTGSEDVESWGYLESTRTDWITDVSSAQFTLQETKRQTLEMFHNVDLSAVVPDVTTGEVSWNKPSVGSTTYRRMIFLSYDGSGTNRIYMIKVMPRAQVTAVDDESWNQSNARAFPMTIQAKVDPVLGYSVREVLAGPGAKSRNVAMGFAAS